MQRISLAFVGILILSGCGNLQSSKRYAITGDVDGDELVLPPPGHQPLPQPSAAPPVPGYGDIAGIYTGSGTQVVFPNGEIWSWGGYGILQMRHGQLSSASNGQYSGMITAGNYGTSSISGSYVPGASLGASTYSASSKSPATVASATGRWWGNLQDGDTPYLTFSSSGSISGTSANLSCSFSGRVEPHPSGLNVLKVTITRANCLRNGNSETFTGIVRIRGATLHLVALNAAKTRTLTWEAYLL